MQGFKRQLYWITHILHICHLILQFEQSHSELQNSFSRTTVFDLTLDGFNWIYESLDEPYFKKCVDKELILSKTGTLSCRSAGFCYNGDEICFLVISISNYVSLVQVSLTIQFNSCDCGSQVLIINPSITLHPAASEKCLPYNIPAINEPLQSFLPKIAFGNDLILSDTPLISFLGDKAGVSNGLFHIISLNNQTLTIIIKCVENSRNKRSIFSNLRAPVFSQQSYSANVREEISLNTQVVQVLATDSDEGSAGVVQYSLMADVDRRSLNFFYIDNRTGWVYTKARVDREEIPVHKFIVRAQDLGSPPNSAQVTLTINVEDINDNPPIFESPYYNLSVYETVDIGTVIYRLRASDLDTGVNRNIKYSIMNSSITDFGIDSDIGDIKVLKPLDRETRPFYSFLVKAEDQATNLPERLSSIVNTTIYIMDYNDNPPVFSKTEYIFSVKENVSLAEGPVIIGAVSATDADEGINGRVSYSITFGNPNPPLFNISDETGQLMVVGALDRDKPGGSEYNLRVKAKDNGVLSLNTIVNVKVIVEDVNDNVPSFRYSTYEYSVYENLDRGTTIATLVATDLDEGVNAQISYSILPTAFGSRFPIMIDGASGVITNNGTLDRELYSSIKFTVRVEDHGLPKLSNTTNVTVILLDRNDNIPQFTRKIYSAIISEDTAVNSEVLTVAATDPDENDFLTYSIIGGDMNGDFRIFKEQSFAIVRVINTLSYNRQRFYNLVVQVKDLVDQASVCSVMINVTAKNRFAPTFKKTSYLFNVSEDAQIGYVIGKVEAADGDEGVNGRLLYSLISQGVVTPFFVNNLTGEIIVNSTLDRDNPVTAQFTVDVMARDQGIPPLQADIPATLTIRLLDVNDNAPVFTQTTYTASVTEDKEVDFSVIKVMAYDPDQPGTPNSQVFYTFDGGDDGGGSFQIDHSSGTIRIKNPLDRETVNNYNLTVLATDRAVSNRLSSSTTVNVKVLDVNDNSPKFETDGVIIRRIFENKPIGTPVEPLIKATDADEGVNAIITFQLVGGDVFAFDLRDLNDGSFRLYSKVPLDYESLRKNFTLEVLAASQFLITKATVVVRVQDMNDNSPELQNFIIVINNYLGVFPAEEIGKVPAFDPDESDRNNLRYTIKSGNEASFFLLNSSTGMITLNQALDSDRPTSGDFVVQVSDGLNNVNATCSLQYRMITDETLANSVTLRLADVSSSWFMVGIYNLLIQALAQVLNILPTQIYIIDIESSNTPENLLNISFAALQIVNGKDVFIKDDVIKEQIFRNLDHIERVSGVKLLPFDDTLCVLEPCANYQKCSISLKFSEAMSFIASDTLLFRPIRTKIQYKCSCPVGFGGVVSSFTCDTEINMCYSNPCINAGTCKQIEGGFSCLCPEGFAGPYCQFDFRNGVSNDSLCPAGLCSGVKSYCVTLLKGGYACQTDESRCEESEDISKFCQLRAVTFTLSSYLMFPSLNLRFRFNIQLSFATRKKSGLLFYNGRYNSDHDFIALELINHTAVFSMSLGNQVYSISLGKKYGLNDGMWHTLKISYRNWSLVFSLDECDIGLNLANPELFKYPCAAKLDIGLAQRCLSSNTTGVFCALDLSSPFFMGGLPEYLNLNRLSTENFVGCMRNLYIDNQLIDLKAAVTNNKVHEGCLQKRNYCETSPCKNQGICVQAWSDYKCLCSEAYGDKDCSQRTGPTSTFLGISYILFSSTIETIRIPWYNSFMFKTTSDNKPLMKIDLKNGRNIFYDLVSGYITFRYGNFSYNFDEVIVNDDQWHQFELRLLLNSKGQGQILMSLDFGEVQRGEALDNSLFGVDPINIWIGGDNTSSINKRGFYGCMKDIKVSSTFNSYLTDYNRKVNLIDKCSKPGSCPLYCPDMVSTCDIGWENSTCVCRHGLVGPSCTNACNTATNPCENKGRCMIDPAADFGYHCECQQHFSGEYCQDKMQLQCPAAWWGSPVCGPCNCSLELNFDSQCDRVTGSCYCRAGFYKPPGSAGCISCNCYYNAGQGGSVSTLCDQQTGTCQCKDGVKGARCDTCDNPFAEITTEGCDVQYDACPKVFTSGIWWTHTKFNHIRIELCPPGSSGNASRVCKNNIDGWLEPNLDNCTSLDFLQLLPDLRKLELRTEANESLPVHWVDSPSYAFTATRVINGLEKATRSTQQLYSNDLIIAVKILREVLYRENHAKSFELTSVKDRFFLANIINATSRILGPHLQTQWTKVLKTYDLKALTGLVRGFDGLITNLAENMATRFVTAGMDPFQIVTDNMVLGMDIIQENNVTIPKYNNIQRDKNMFDKETSVQLPSKLFEENVISGLKEKSVAGYVLYKSVGSLVLQTSQSSPYDNTVRSPQYGTVMVNSAVFSLVLQQGLYKPHSAEPLEFTYLLVDPEYKTNPQCVFLKTDGIWSTEGCKVKVTLSNRVVCSCNHLSTFALITDVYANMDGLTAKVTTYMYVAIALSLACFLFTLLVLLCMRDLRSNNIYVQINIQLCCSVSLIVFVAGSDKWYNKPACTVVAVLLQFFVISLFSWTFVYSLHLYRWLTEKRNVDRDSMILYIILGYVIPGIITGLTVGIHSEDFGTETFCWISVDKPIIWSLASPIFFCCVACLILFSVSLLNAYQNEASKHKKEAKQLKVAVWKSIVYVALILCTWIFALLSTSTPPIEQKSYNYIFAVFVCCTALFVLLSQVIFNPQGCNELHRRWKQCQGQGQLDGDSELTDKHLAFGEHVHSDTLGRGRGVMSLTLGSESSTTSGSRLTGAATSDLLGYLHAAPSSTTSEMPNAARYRRTRHRRHAPGDSSDSDSTDSDIRTERERDIDLASSHSSDEDDPIPPGTAKTGAVQASDSVSSEPGLPLRLLNSHLMTADMGFAPPPPYFMNGSRQWSGRLSDSTNSTRGSFSKADSVSTRSSTKNNSIRPATLSSFAGKRTESPNLSTSDRNHHSLPRREYTNPTYLNSPLAHDRNISVKLKPQLPAQLSSQTSSPHPAMQKASITPISSTSEKSKATDQHHNPPKENQEKDPQIVPIKIRGRSSGKQSQQGSALPRVQSPVLSSFALSGSLTRQGSNARRDSDSVTTNDQSSTADDVFMPQTSAEIVAPSKRVTLESIDVLQGLNDETQV